MATPTRPLTWIILALGGTLALCCLGSTVVVGLGLLGDDGDAPSTTPTSPAGPSAGGFSFTPAQGFVADGPGRFKAVTQNNTETNTVAVVHLAAVPGLEDAERKLQRLWVDALGNDWGGVKPDPLVMRRFVSNGARAFFTSSELRTKQGALARVTIFLVEADDRLEPLVFIQTSDDPSNPGGSRDLFARLSWPASWAIVEAALQNVRGSPLAATLLADDEVTGHWSFGTGGHQQWVDTLTGAESMTAVAWAVEYEFTDDHHYAYRFKGAAGRVGAQRFSTDDAEGTWALNHDVLTLTPDSGPQVQYLTAGAPIAPDGQRLLFLLPKPHWSLQPDLALAHGELYSPK